MQSLGAVIVSHAASVGGASVVGASVVGASVVGASVAAVTGTVFDGLEPGLVGAVLPPLLSLLHAASAQQMATMAQNG